MEERKPVIGLSWEPKLPPFSSSSSKILSDNSENKFQVDACNTLWKKNTDLVDGLFVPPNNPKKLNKLLRKQVEDTAGKNWFDMSAPTITPELKADLQLLKLRSVLDPKRFYKGDSKTKKLPKYFQVGTVEEPPSEFFSGRLNRKQRKQTFADELLMDSSLTQYRQRKVREIDEQRRPGGVDKWKKKKGTQPRKKMMRKKAF